MTVMFWPVVVFMAISLAIGLYTYTKVRGSSTRFTVCEKSLPFIVVGTTLMAQAVDGNSTLGAVSITYTGSVWAGLMISIGLAASLFIVGRFLAAPLNRMNLLTLPEFFYRRYGQQTELLVSVLTIVSFTVLIAGNLSAVAWVLSVVSGSDYLPALVVATVGHRRPTRLPAACIRRCGPTSSRIYIALDRLCRGGDLADRDARLRRDGRGGPGGNGGHVVARQPARSGALVNWAGMIALGVRQHDGARLHGARVRRARRPHGPPRLLLQRDDDAGHRRRASAIIGLAGVASVQGAADPRMVLPTMAVEVLPYWMGVLVFIGVLGASMSTANGAILVISVVLARNVIQRWRPTIIEDSADAPPVALHGDCRRRLPRACVAYVRPEPGILLIVAFDIVLAGCVVPLFAGVYWPKANAAGAHGRDRRRHGVAAHRALRDAGGLGRARHADAAGA